MHIVTVSNGLVYASQRSVCTVQDLSQNLSSVVQLAQAKELPVQNSNAFTYTCAAAPPPALSKSLCVGTVLIIISDGLQCNASDSNPLRGL